jgi:glycogen synthase
LLQTYGLPFKVKDCARPLIGMISRMVDQKGFDLIASLADELPALGATFVVLGTGERRHQDLWRTLAAKHPDVIGARIGFDEGLAHLIEGGSDIFLMPSRFEPCGLNQMYSLRYGTVPLVRATGGLRDTVRDVDAVSGQGTVSRSRSTHRAHCSTRCGARSTPSGTGPFGDASKRRACGRTSPGTHRPDSMLRFMRGQRTAPRFRKGQR